MAILSSLVARCFAFQLGHVPAGALVVVGVPPSEAQEAVLCV